MLYKIFTLTSICALLAVNTAVIASTGIGKDGSDLVPLPGSQYAVVSESFHTPFNLNSNLFPNTTQQASQRIDVTFYVYHETTHGADDYFVICQQDGMISMGDSVCEQAIRNGTLTTPDNSHSNGDPRQLFQGFFLYRFDNEVSPDIAGANWVYSSPQSINETSTISTTAVDTYTTTVTIGADSNGGKGDVSESYSKQLWYQKTMSITDWGITEKSDAESNKGAWSWYQNLPWSGKNVDISNFTWWENAYNVGGGWDDIKVLPGLSLNTLQYHCSIGWKFPSSLIQNNQLNVTFNGKGLCYTAAIAMPQCNNTGHHNISYHDDWLSWSKSIDLVNVVKKS
ncbi:MAG: hypothetical protein Q8S21_03820 [Candidatus Paracaedibacteraceae bacterium]|nr:hypothetical protein [Candidatus Paracaedibacteraceae bacterium]